MRIRLLTASAVAAVLLSGLGCESEPAGLQPVRLALDFQPNAVHSGIYTAIRDGADERHGVDIEVRVPSASSD